MGCLISRAVPELTFNRDIHPNATLTRIYFQNLFCLESCADRVLENILRPVNGKGKEKEEITPDASELGIKIGLGDTGMRSEPFVFMSTIDNH